MKSLAVFLAALGPLAAFAAACPAPSAIALTVNDLTPKFLAFHDAAQKERATPERRWQLFKQHYDFAAVPPTDEGQEMARKLLDEAWPRYGPVVARLRSGAGALEPAPADMVRSIAALLCPQRPGAVRLTTFVGGFEENAFTAAHAGRITVALPLEIDAGRRALLMAHELTHAVHIAMGSFAGGWVRSIGTTVLTEGLAMRVTERLFPGRPARDYVEHEPGWLEKARARRLDILRAIRPHLASEDSEQVMRFTMGRGPNGLEREAYYAGWEVVGHWLAHGKSFAEIARIPETEMPARVREAIDALLAR